MESGGKGPAVQGLKTAFATRDGTGFGTKIQHGNGRGGVGTGIRLSNESGQNSDGGN